MDDDLEDITKAVEEFRRSGAVAPYIVVMVSPNGALMLVRYSEAADGSLSWEVLNATELRPDDDQPMHCMAVDQTGKAARIIMGPAGVTFH